MAGQDQTRSSRRDDEDTPEPEPVTQAQAQADTSDLDDLLDDIDAALESNAETFVKQFQQKGGQ